jgi:hypothetical protein
MASPPAAPLLVRPSLPLGYEDGKTYFKVRPEAPLVILPAWRALHGPPTLSTPFSQGVGKVVLAGDVGVCHTSAVGGVMARVRLVK